MLGIELYAIFATGKTGFGTGLTGYFYPLYLDKEKVPKPFHIHTFEEYEDIVFYMPNSSKNHAKNTYNAELYTLYGSSGQSGGTSGGSGGY